MNHCKHGHIDGALHRPCYQCRAEFWEDQANQFATQSNIRGKKLADVSSELNAIHALAMNPQDTEPRASDKYTVALLRQLLSQQNGTHPE